MKADKDTLKKHHFWIVSGVSLFLALLAFVFLSSDVDGAITKKTEEIKKAEADAKGPKAPGKIALTTLEEQKKTLGGKKDELWKSNWEEQKKIFTWPVTGDKLFDDYNALKFGDPLPKYDDQRADVFRREATYKAAYEDMAKSVAPTKFLNGWQGVLGERYIAQWGEKRPEPRQLWLAMEDMWVTKAMLDPVKQINASASTYSVVDPAAPPLKRAFTNGIWKVELEVVDQPPNRVMKGKLRNLSKQMQLLGAGSTMTLRVWLDSKLDLNRPEQAFEFKIEGEFVPGDTEIPVAPLGSHILVPGTTAVEIAKVEQVLDDRTVPVRQINALSLKKLSAKDYRAVETTLPPEFWKEDDTTTTPGVPSLTPGTGTGGGGPANVPIMMGRGEGGREGGSGGGRPGMGGRPNFSVPGAAGAASSTTVSNADLVTAVNGNRLRYVEVNSQLRRMPVAVQIVCDLHYMQDIMTAYANSPLRFQIVQYHWNRFRGTLATDPVAPGTTSTSSGGADAGNSIRGSLGDSLAGVSALGGRGESGPGAMASPNLPPTGGNFLPGLVGGQLASVSEAQANSSLIELTIYGIVTLYEKYDDKKAATAGAGTPIVTPVNTAPAAPAAPAAPVAPAAPTTPMVTPATPPMPATPKETPKP